MESLTLHKAPKVWKYSLISASKADTHFGCWRHWFSVTLILHTGNSTDGTGITNGAVPKEVEAVSLQGKEGAEETR